MILPVTMHQMLRLAVNFPGKSKFPLQNWKDTWLVVFTFRLLPHHRKLGKFTLAINETQLREFRKFYERLW